MPSSGSPRNCRPTLVWRECGSGRRRTEPWTTTTSSSRPMWTRCRGQNSQTKKNLGFESRGSSQAALVPNHPSGPQRSPLDADRKVSSLRINMSKLSCIIIILFRFDLALRTDRPAAGRPHTWALPTIYRCNYCPGFWFSDELWFKNLMTPRFPHRWGDIASGHQLGRRLFGPPHTGAIVKIANKLKC